MIDANLFAGVKDARTSSYPDDPAAGRYIVRVDEVLMKETSGAGGRSKKRFLTINYTVLSVVATEDGHPAHRVGDVCNHRIFRDGNDWSEKYFQRDLKAFIVAMNPELNLDAMSEEEFVSGCVEMVGEAQPLKGYVAELVNGVSYAKSAIDEDGNPHPGARAFITPMWKSPLNAAAIQQELGEDVVARFGLLAD